MSNLRRVRIGLLATAALLLSGSAQAQIKVPSSNPPPSSGTPSSGTSQAPVFKDYSYNQALALAKEIGIDKARLTKNTKKEDYVAGEVNGVSAAIYREKCGEAGSCEVLSFYAYFGKKISTDLAFMNAFNRSYFAKLIQVGDRDTTLEMNVLLYDGVTEDHIRQLARIFVASVKLARDFKPS